MLTTLDISITEQVRAYRRLMMHQIATLAPLAEHVIIPVVPGNHDETTRTQVMPLSDSWAIEGAMAVEDWMDGRPEYEHVRFIFPPEGEPDIYLEVTRPDDAYQYGMAFIHGHTPGKSPNLMLEWWKGQSHGRQAAGNADMLVSAHFHHLARRTQWRRPDVAPDPGAGRRQLVVPPPQGRAGPHGHRVGRDHPGPGPGLAGSNGPLVTCYD